MVSDQIDRKVTSHHMTSNADFSELSTIVCPSFDQLNAGRPAPPRSMIHFPFWLVIPAGAPATLADVSCGGERLPLVFSTAGKMAAYLALRHGGKWDVRLVNRYSFTQSMTAVRRSNFDCVCIDIEADGSGGRRIQISDLSASLDVSEF